MPTSTEATWELFLDESGLFDPSHGAVHVAGILIDASPRFCSPLNFRPALRKVFPGIKYPPHAVHLTTVPGYVACWLLAGSPEEGPLPVEAFRCCRDLLATHPAAPAAAEAWRAFAAGRERKLPPGAAWSLQAWLERTHPEAAAAARQHVEDRQEVLHRMLSAFLKVREGRVAVVGSHDLSPSVAPSLPEPVRQHRYLVHLTTVLERVIALVAGENHDAEVHVRVGERWLVHETPKDGPFEGRPLFLGRSHLEAAAEAARAGLGEMAAGVRLLCYPPERYDAQVHPAIAVADFVSHSLVAPLGDASTFHEIILETRANLGLPCTATSGWLREAGNLPAISANGPAQELIRAAQRGAPRPAPARIRPGWARDQANAWTTAFEAARGPRP